MPARVGISRGSRVTWIDRDRSDHTVTFAHADQPGVDNLRPVQGKTVPFKEPGTFSYVCDHHPIVKGTVEVVTGRGGPGPQTRWERTCPNTSR